MEMHDIRLRHRGIQGCCSPSWQEQLVVIGEPIRDIRETLHVKTIHIKATGGHPLVPIQGIRGHDRDLVATICKGPAQPAKLALPPVL